MFQGWYSFILGSMYGFLLTFGFIMMTPQLFINYKLKSVAHLPWRMMTYKVDISERGSTNNIFRRL